MIGFHSPQILVCLLVSLTHVGIDFFTICQIVARKALYLLRVLDNLFYPCPMQPNLLSDFTVAHARTV